MSDEMDLNRQRGILKGQITRFKNYLDSINQSSIDQRVIIQVSARLSNIEPLLDEFSRLQLQLSKLKLDNGQTDFEQGLEAENEIFEDNYFSAITEAKAILAENAPSSSVVNSESHQTNNLMHEYSNVKLPTIQLPKFIGNYENWIEFRDTFNSLIHKNAVLPNIQKFHYLRSSLAGEARDIIQSIQLSDANYESAWAALIERYDNKRLIVHTHIKSLLNLPTLNRETHVGLRQLLDGMSKHLRALEVLKQPIEHWNVLLIYLMSEKLDHGTKREWESYQYIGDFPTINDFKAFLKRRCELLESINFDKIHHEIAKKPNFNKSINSKSFVTINKENTTSYCNFCKSSDHSIYKCESFKALPVNVRISEIKDRKSCINCLRGNHFVKSCKAPLCRLCSKKHHTLLHLSPISQTNLNPLTTPVLGTQTDLTALSSEGSRTAVTTPEAGITSRQVLSSSMSNKEDKNCEQVLLSTAVVGIENKAGNIISCRIVLDSGSQTNFVTQELCELLNLHITKVNLAITGINQVTSNLTNKVDVVIHSRYNSYCINIPCIVIPNITGNVPNRSFDSKLLNIPQNLKLADPKFNISDKIDVLIGSQIFWELICVGQIKLSNQGILQKTRLGWIVAGPLRAVPLTTRHAICNISIDSDQAVQDQLKRFWEIEECVNESIALSEEEQACEQHFLNNTTRDVEGRFIVSIPLRQSANKLGESKQRAINCFLSLEKRLQKKFSLREQYVACMNEYIKLGHMSEVKDIASNKVMCYLPHQGVEKQESVTSKLRVVFNASAKTTSNVSLNDIQMVGPVIQDDLFSILLRFRKYKYVFSSDIVKMYRQVLINPDQRCLQRIVWRETPNKPLKHFELNTVTYGTASGSFLAIRALQQLTYNNFSAYPEACSIILNSFYVDDLLSGADTVEGAIALRDQIISILKQGCFELRKWNSNHPEILKFTDETSKNKMLTLGSELSTKTLGLRWHPKFDTLGYRLKGKVDHGSVTKRLILSKISEIFDPLGLLGPIVIVAKVLLQQLWQYKLSWDESLPSELHTRWLRFQDELHLLEKLELPRYVLIDRHSQIEIHGFADASDTAYGACIYMRSQTDEGSILARLLCAKSKVAPLKTVTIPRLELCAALLLTRLMRKVQSSLKVNISRTILWSDSTVALAWINTAPNMLKPFVSNRVAEIQSLTNVENWRHVNSNDNPADLISRGTNTSKLLRADLWWNGPKWLAQSEGLWPVQKPHLNSEENSELFIREKRKTGISLIASKSNNLEIFSRYSSFTKLKRVVAYCLRFKTNALHALPQRTSGELTVEELNKALIVLIKIAQAETFSHDIRCLRSRNNQIDRGSKLLPLNPFIDKCGILRVGGRLQNSDFHIDKKHPMLLPAKHDITNLIIEHEHKRLFHAGPQAVLASVRETFWPISGRNSVRRVIRNCIICFRNSPIVIDNQMGSLPEDRVNPKSPFEVTGLDYCGPILIKDRKGRGCKVTKCYVSLFICFATKAIHLELVSDLTTEAFLASLKRFIARRGSPRTLYSDNGSNFVGAAKELKQLLNTSNMQKTLTSVCSNQGINWKFIAPRSPHLGGLWEAGIKTVKYHLKRVVGNALLTFEELYTYLVQIEGILNSRPLAPLTNDPNDLYPITPAHFLIGKTLIGPPDPNWVNINPGRLSNFQRVQQLTQHFWNRWSKEYVGELQVRTKWKTRAPNLLQPGKMVIIREDNIPPLKWRLGRIVETHPGQDGISRIVTIRCSNGVQKRAASKVCVLPFKQNYD